jgi:hypothetical protein
MAHDPKYSPDLRARRCLHLTRPLPQRRDPTFRRRRRLRYHADAALDSIRITRSGSPRLTTAHGRLEPYRAFPGAHHGRSGRRHHAGTRRTADEPVWCGGRAGDAVTAARPARLHRSKMPCWWRNAHGPTFVTSDASGGRSVSPECSRSHSGWCSASRPADLDEILVSPLRGRSRKGQRLCAAAPFDRWRRRTLITGLRCRGVGIVFLLEPVGERWSRPE